MNYGQQSSRSSRREEIMRARKYENMYNIKAPNTFISQIESVFSLHFVYKIIQILDAKIGFRAFCSKSTFIF